MTIAFPESKTYEGYVNGEGTASVLVKVNHGSAHERHYNLLMSRLAQQKSPTGFAWGYSGSGPTALAHSLLLDLMGADVANAFHIEFRDVFISTLPEWFHSTQHPGRIWVLQGDTMRRWVRHVLADHPGAKERVSIAARQSWPDNSRSKRERQALEEASYREEEQQLERLALEDPDQKHHRERGRGIF